MKRTERTSKLTRLATSRTNPNVRIYKHFSTTRQTTQAESLPYIDHENNLAEIPIGYSSVVSSELSSNPSKTSLDKKVELLNQKITALEDEIDLNFPFNELKNNSPILTSNGSDTALDPKRDQPLDSRNDPKYDFRYDPTIPGFKLDPPDFERNPRTYRSDLKSYRSDSKSNRSESKTHASDIKTVSNLKTNASNVRTHTSDVKTHGFDAKTHAFDATPQVSDLKSHRSDSKSDGTSDFLNELRSDFRPNRQELKNDLQTVITQLGTPREDLKSGFGSDIFNFKIKTPKDDPSYALKMEVADYRKNLNKNVLSERVERILAGNLAEKENDGRELNIGSNPTKGNSEKNSDPIEKELEKLDTDKRKTPEDHDENHESLFDDDNDDDLQPSDPQIYEPVIEITSARKRPRKDTSLIESEILRSLLKRHREPPEEDDEDKMFLLSLMPSFKKMDEDVKFATRIEILQVVRRNLQTNYFPTASASNPIL